MTTGASHRFRCFTPAGPVDVWTALTDGRHTRQFLHGLAADSTWRPGAPISFRTSPEVDPPVLTGEVLCVEPERRLSYVLTSGPHHPCTYLTWHLDAHPEGSIVRLQVDRAEHADTEEEAEAIWLPALAALQRLLSRGGTRRT